MEKWGEVGVINGRGLGDGSKRRREWDRQVSGREKERAKKEKTHPKKGGALKKRGSDRCLGGMSIHVPALYNSWFIYWVFHPGTLICF